LSCFPLVQRADLEGQQRVDRSLPIATADFAVAGRASQTG
jgi:hypothetical protein